MQVTIGYRERLARRGVAWRARYEMCLGYFDGALGEVMDIAVSEQVCAPKTGGIECQTGVGPQHANDMTVLMTMPGAEKQELQADVMEYTRKQTDHPQGLIHEPTAYFAMASVPSQSGLTDARCSGFSIDTILWPLDANWTRAMFDGACTSPRPTRPQDSQHTTAASTEATTCSVSKATPSKPAGFLAQTKNVPFGSVLLHRADTSHRGVAGMAEGEFDTRISEKSRQNGCFGGPEDLDHVSWALSPRMHVKMEYRRDRHRAAKPPVRLEISERLVQYAEPPPPRKKVQRKRRASRSS